MFKTFNNDTLFLNDHLIVSVMADPPSNPKSVIVTCLDGNAHRLSVPEGMEAKAYALRVVKEMNQFNVRLYNGDVAPNEDDFVQKA